MALTMSAPAIENGPGPQCTWSVSSCDTTGTISLDAQLRLVEPRIVLARRHTIIVNSPPGLSALADVAHRGARRLKNIVPKREKA